LTTVRFSARIHSIKTLHTRTEVKMLSSNQLFTMRENLDLIRDTHFHSLINVYRQPLVGVVLKIGIIYQATDSPNDWWHEGAWSHIFIFGDLSITDSYRIFKEDCNNDYHKSVLSLLSRDDKVLLSVSPNIADIPCVRSVTKDFDIDGMEIWTGGDVGGYKDYHVSQVVENLHERVHDYIPSTQNIHPSWATQEA
jgi:hypothetical protein